MRPVAPLLTVSDAPHIHCGLTVERTVQETILALLPALAMAIATYGMDAARVVALSCSTAVGVEFLCWKILKRTPEIEDWHGFLIGMLFAFLLPATAPWWLVVCGSSLSVVIGKMIFGGIGGSPLCAPLVGWATCRVSWGGFLDPYTTVLDTSLPAPLHMLKYYGADSVADLSSSALFLGQQLGGLGTSQVSALLLGGAFLIVRKHIDWRVPLFFLTGIVATAWIYQLLYPGTYGTPLFHVLTGSTVFGAFFLATDWSSSPIGALPNILYGLLAGALVIIIRVYGIYPDGVPFAILLANLCAPLFERIRPKPFGTAKARRA